MELSLPISLPISSTSTPLLGPLTEICIVTPSLQATISALSSLLSIGPFRVFHFNAHTVPIRELRSRRHPPPTFDLLVAFAQLSPTLTLEIMQPNLSAGDESIMGEWLVRNGGRAGVQHLAFEMGGGPMEERIGRMRERGFEVVMQGAWKGEKGECRFVFFDTEAKGVGVCVETIEFGKGWAEPEPMKESNRDKAPRASAPPEQKKD